jgi:SAM-dependent methyltransferase
MSSSIRLNDAAAYGRSFCDVYDRWYAHHDVGPILSALGTTEGPILELGVGTGRIALALANAGLDVCGLDSSPEMLAELRAKPDSERIRVFQADMARFAVAPGCFDVVLAAFNVVFNLVDEHSVRDCFASCAAALAPGGSLIIDAAVIEPGQSTTAGVAVADIDVDELVLTVSVQNSDRQVIRGQHIEVADGNVSLRPWLLHYASPDQLDALAESAGLVPSARWADWTGREWAPGDVRHISWFTRIT